MPTLTYDGKLNYNGGIIKKADEVIKLRMDMDVDCFGVFTLSNDVVKTIQFIKQGDVYHGRLVITEDDLPFIKTNKFQIKIIDNCMSKTSNDVVLFFDEPTIQLTISKTCSREVHALALKIKALETDIKNLTANHRLIGIKITDTSYIKKGMVPVAADDKGNFIAAYPFEDSINKINGLESVNRELLIGAKDIPFDDTRKISEVMTALGLAINQVNLSVEAIATLQQDLLNKITEVELRLDEHLGTPII
jgi:hypothetical protein